MPVKPGLEILQDMEMFGVPTLHCAGRIDSTTRSYFSRTLREFFDNNSFDLVLDLNDVVHIGAAGMDTLTSAVRHAHQNRGEIAVVRSNKKRTMLSLLTEFTESVRIFENLSSANRFFGAETPDSRTSGSDAGELKTSTFDPTEREH